MSYSLKAAGRADLVARARKPLAVAALVALAALVQACSASREDGAGGSSSMWGNDKPKQTASGNREWQQPSSFDKDGPPAQGSTPTYRGGRDPVTGRANDWPPATPPPVESAALPPIPGQGAPPGSYQSPPYGAPPPAPYSATPAYQRAPVATAQPAAAGAGSVEVRQGDTLFRIAKANNTTVAALKQANGLTTESIRPGQRLTIPGR